MKQNKQKRLAIIGMTDLYLSNRIEEREYLSHVRTYITEAGKHNGSSDKMEVEENFFDGRVSVGEEFRFSLTRHWSLFESMFYSRYVATSLTTWKENGRRKLQTLLVKMGKNDLRKKKGKLNF
jgi:cell division control protein 45